MSLPTSPAVANGSAPNVLIVEDDAATRRLYKFLLTNGGYPVLEAEDGVAALEQLALHQCDLVITDMNMPRMDGMDLIGADPTRLHRHLCDFDHCVRHPRYRKAGDANGANHYLAKPFDFEELERRVRAFFQSRAKPA